MSETENISLPIGIQGVTKTYGPVFALDDVTLDVRSGEFMTLLGPSGSGKTTLLMVLAGFIRPDCGEILFGATDVVSIPPHKRYVGMVFQNYALFPHMSVGQNVAYPLKIRKVGKAETAERVKTTLDLVRLGEFLERRVDQLSGGQCQRVALARAIVFEPRILLMDEPLSALDKKLREVMQIELRKLHEELGITTVYVTHDQREALTMSDRIAVINEGKIIQIDTPKQLYERPENYFVADFIGESSFLEISVKNLEATIDGEPLKLSAGQQLGPGRNFLMLRPEKIVLVDEQNRDDRNVFKGVVEEVIYRGDVMELLIALGTGESITMRRPTGRDDLKMMPSVGSEVVLGLHEQDTVVVSEK
jgi:putative spermidine/putrescine transport system ATP-binding protein